MPSLLAWNRKSCQEFIPSDPFYVTPFTSRSGYEREHRLIFGTNEMRFVGGCVLQRQSAAVEHNQMMLAPLTALELAIGTGQSQLPKDQSHRHLPNRCQALLKATLERTRKFPLSSHCSPQNSHRRMVSYAAFGNKLKLIDKQTTAAGQSRTRLLALPQGFNGALHTGSPKKKGYHPEAQMLCIVMSDGKSFSGARNAAI